MSCQNCPYPQPLCFAVYCQKDPELRDLPASQGDYFGPPILQAVAPGWCPLDSIPSPTCVSTPTINC